MQHDPRDLVSVGTFRVRLEQAHVGDGLLLVVVGERGFSGREIGDIRIEGRYGRSRVGKEEDCWEQSATTLLETNKVARSQRHQLK